jgi:hypothetical protein
MPTYKNPKPSLPGKAREVAELMADGFSRTNIAEKMGVKPSTVRRYEFFPGFKAHYLQSLEAIREGERGRNLKAAIGIRDDQEMAKSAAGNRARLEAARFLEGRDGGVTVNVGVNATIAPGYQVVIPQQFADAAPQILNLARSTRNVLESQDDDAEDAEIIQEEVPQPRPLLIVNREPAFGGQTPSGRIPRPTPTPSRPGPRRRI